MEARRHHPGASAGLLDNYHTERHPLGAQFLAWSRTQVALMQPAPAACALHAIVRDLMQTRDGATYFAGRVWGLATHYPLGGAHPLVGHSVPNFELEDGTTTGELLRDGHGLLLDCEGNASLELLASDYSGCLKYVAGRAKDQLGLQAALIRPDGIVAWASNHAPDYHAFREAAARWFAGKPASLP